MKRLRGALSKLIETAKDFGLNEDDLTIAREYLMNNEFLLCFDMIITQMYEFNIKIDIGFYETLSKTAKEMNLGQEEYSYMRELIKDDHRA